MTREEAINKVRWRLMGLVMDKDVRDAFEMLIPELHENEGERMMKNIRLAILSVEDAFWRTHGLTAKEAISYIERQKEQEHICDSAQYEEGFKTGLEIGLRKQKEQKPISQEDFDTAKHEALWDERKPADEEKIEMTDFEQSVYDLCPVLGIEEAKATASELLELAKKTLLKTGKVVLTSNYPEGCSFEDGFHLGYNEGFNAKQKEQKPAEWSEEDEKRVKEAIKRIDELEFLGIPCNNVRKVLESLRPSWKPSEEQMNVLRKLFIEGIKALTQTDCNTLNSIYLDLKKLM